MVSASTDPLKRVVDVALAVSALLVLAPLVAFLALLVRFRLGGPVFFRQVRPGLHGAPFELVKFRTMRDGDGSDDDRMTAFGQSLRSLSLDELPELWNVVRGDMSLVGPRPLLTEYLPLYSTRQARRHEVRPGLTGLAQVSGRNLVGWDDRFELDVHYVETRSIRLDARIILRTLKAVIRREGISSGNSATMERFTGPSGVVESREQIR